MAAGEAPKREANTSKRPVFLNRLQRERGATRRETASAQLAEERVLDRRPDAAIDADREDQDVLRQIQCSFNNFARRMAVKKSRSTSPSRLPTMDGVATRTIVTG